MKVLCTAFKGLQFGFVIFWRKDFGAKAKAIRQRLGKICSLTIFTYDQHNMFIVHATGVDILKLFSSSLTPKATKLDCFSLASIFSLALHLSATL
jgi:hypothetical protein